MNYHACTKGDVQNWQLWNRQGFFPGLDESEAQFVARIDYCLHLKKNLDFAEIPVLFENKNELSPHLLQEAWSVTEKLYGIYPQWVLVCCSNYQLMPWHGGCAWIFKTSDSAPLAAFIQLRGSFYKRSNYLGIYNRTEIVTHELAHIGRMAYPESKFEELFAYQTSKKWWRQALGPIVESARESVFFIITLSALVGVDLFLFISLEYLDFWHLFIWLHSIPFLLITLAGVRLAYRHYTYKKCLYKLNLLLEDKKKAKHLLYRLSDAEIVKFSHLSPQAIRTYINNASLKSFRWHFFQAIYLV